MIRLIPFLLIIFIIILIYLIFKKNVKSQKNFLKISFIILFVFLAIRGESTGTDLPNYHFFYDLLSYYNIKDLLKSNYFEIGYTLYSYIIHLISNGNFRFFLVVTAFFSLIGIYDFIKRYSKNYLLSIIVYICLQYYLFIFSGLRQGIALSIVCFSIRFIVQRKFWKFLCLVCIATTFHLSALIFLPAYFLSEYDINDKKLFFAIGLIIIIYIFRYNIVYLFASLFFSNYSLNDNFGNGYSLLVIYFVIFIFISIFKRNFLGKEELKLNNICYNYLYIGILIQVLATVEGNAHRATFYYLITILCTIPKISLIFSSKDKLLVNIILIILLIIYFILISGNLVYKIF